MNDFSHIDEREFLEGYTKFSINIRPFIIKRLTEQYRCATSIEEKEMLYILAFEQHFLLEETFKGFLRAIKNRHNKSIFNSLTRDSNINSLHKFLKTKTTQDIIRELNVSVEQSEKKESFVKIISIWQKEDSYKGLKQTDLLFNKIKHKLLIYKNKKGKKVFVLDKKQEENLEKYHKEAGIIKEENLVEDIDYLSNIAVDFKNAILFLIEERLRELG